MLVTDVPTGTPLAELGDQLTDATLASRVVDASTSCTRPGSPTAASTADRLLIARGRRRSSSRTSASPRSPLDEYRRNRDVAAVLVATSLLVDEPPTDTATKTTPRTTTKPTTASRRRGRTPTATHRRPSS